jgi:hypothetical protein
MTDYYLVNSGFHVKTEIISQQLAAFYYHCVKVQYIPYCSNDNQLLTRPIGEKGVFDKAVTKLREFTAPWLTTP